MQTIQQRIQKKKRQLGQGMTEYIIIVALIAIAAIGAFTLFGDTVRNQVGSMAAELGGDASAAEAANTRATTAGKDSADLGNTKVNLSSYNETATKGGDKK